MPEHEFAIMDRAPRPGEWYSGYDPEDYYPVAAVDDCYLEDVLEKFAGIPVYWQTVDQPGSCLDYCGITLIPPESLPAFLSVVRALPGFGPLLPLLEQAEKEGKFVIHFGI